MNAKSLIMLSIAAGCGLVGMIAVQNMSPEKQETDKVEVLIAIADIDPGIKLSEENVQFQAVPRELVPQDAITSKEEFEERAITKSVGPGTMIVKKWLGKKGIFGAVAEIPKGMTLFTVPVDFAMIHSGMLQAKNRVDVLLTTKIITKDHQERELTGTLLEDVEVFATDSTRQATGEEKEEEKKAKNVTLLVSFGQAQMLTLAKKKGELNLAPRALNDVGKRKQKPVTEQELIVALALGPDAAAKLLGRDVPKEEPKEDGSEQPKTDDPNEPSAFEKLQANKDGSDGNPNAKTNPPIEVAKATWTIKVHTAIGTEELKVDLPNEKVIEPLNVVPSSGGKGAVNRLGASLGDPAKPKAPVKTPPAPKKKQLDKIKSTIEKLKALTQKP